VNTLNEQPQTSEKGWSSSLGVGRGANNLSPYNRKIVTKNQKEFQTRTDSLAKRPKQQTMDIRFGMWNIRSLYRADSLLTV
jgi:hypothetical protein